jgi:hypothetical protein
MREIFSEKFNSVTFEFKRVAFKLNEVWYDIRFNDNGNKNSLRMHKDEEGAWRIAPQVLPIWVQEMDIELGEAIAKNELS